LELAEACDVPVRWSCRTGVCHTCECGLISGSVKYDPEQQLQALGIKLPALPESFGAYVEAVQTDNLLFLWAGLSLEYPDRVLSSAKAS
jgi:hypothetical protein